MKAFNYRRRLKLLTSTQEASYAGVQSVAFPEARAALLFLR